MTKAIPGKRKRGRQKTRWNDVCKRDMQTVGLREGDDHQNPLGVIYYKLSIYSQRDCSKLHTGPTYTDFPYLLKLLLI